MEAKDTVMSDEQLEENIRKDFEDFRVRDEPAYNQDILLWIREAQAEISFKAGLEQGFTSADLDEVYKAGLNEVVGWVVRHAFKYIDTDGFTRVHYPFSDDELQDQLKDWGLSDA